jgi:hypothetical protein
MWTLHTAVSMEPSGAFPQGSGSGRNPHDKFRLVRLPGRSRSVYSNNQATLDQAICAYSGIRVESRVHGPNRRLGRDEDRVRHGYRLGGRSIVRLLPESEQRTADSNNTQPKRFSFHKHPHKERCWQICSQNGWPALVCEIQLRSGLSNADRQCAPQAVEVVSYVLG